MQRSITITFEKKSYTKQHGQHETDNNNSEGDFLRDNIDMYEPILVLMIVSALEVDEDEGKKSLDRSRLTIFNGSNCLNCGTGFCGDETFSKRNLSPNSSSNGSSKVIVFIIVRVRFVSSMIKSSIRFSNEMIFPRSNPTVCLYLLDRP